uniref:Uncharacterized protein n=1 Tax=Chromera velia CCMP2878 TaxID=1169474 RepID=A0A0G4G541_9ALVE|eukprot:Cvel_20332.t1-p1 / transcript=Cvel_20332.t1 / gene=Cvel_20332 / organism=Chromera_velia_CCMP2878 / gene_product=hypothetical protein / transcript_product=hypothetical protein / location=Cvel_scaffold1816:20409-26667(+) / protein_length=303 / sequence_SO=supercontig / SO=protein_coding / is_pseudo=false
MMDTTLGGLRGEGMSADLRAFIKRSFEPLVAIVKELDDRLSDCENENKKLRRRLTAAESELAAISEFTNGTKLSFDIPHALGRTENGNQLEGVKSPERGDTKELYAGLANAVQSVFRPERREQTEALPQSRTEAAAAAAETSPGAAGERSLESSPWLFSCPMGTPVEDLCAVLDFARSAAVRFDVANWGCERDMWEDVVRVFNAGSLPAVQVDYQAFLRTLAEAAKLEVMMVLSGVPGKEEAAENINSMKLVALYVLAMADAWKATEETEADKLGRVAVVLEGNGIGSRLRASDRRFSIEPLE